MVERMGDLEEESIKKAVAGRRSRTLWKAPDIIVPENIVSRFPGRYGSGKPFRAEANVNFYTQCSLLYLLLYFSCYGYYYDYGVVQNGFSLSSLKRIFWFLFLKLSSFSPFTPFHKCRLHISLIALPILLHGVVFLHPLAQLWKLGGWCVSLWLCTPDSISGRGKKLWLVFSGSTATLRGVRLTLLEMK